MPTSIRSLLTWLAIAASGTAGFVILVVVYTGQRHRSRHAEFVGAEACATCHASEASAWSTSQHARWMQVASDQSALVDIEKTISSKQPPLIPN